ncbi:MAG: autorepressor SdpR family transcription factor [Butyricicoccus sp.]|nr:winged helix-turn-helix transcriptional regulator [Butyricicoccus sp.]
MGFQQTFKALSDPTRREILQLLKDNGLTAGEIAARFDTSAATISHHLSILRDAGLVSDEKRGKYIYYELNMSVVDEILGWLSALKGGET